MRSPAPDGRRRDPLLALPEAGVGTAGISPGDHVRLLTELLQPVGPELARRWLAILAMVPREEREELIRAIADRVVERYSGSKEGEGARPRELRVVSPEVFRNGYVEHRESTYVVNPNRGGMIPVVPRAPAHKRA